MNLTCACGNPATWYLVYGCEQYQHVWEAYMCRQCLYLTIGFPKSHIIRDRVYAAHTAWTCMNVQVAPDMRGNMNDMYADNGKVHCEVTSWYAREITPEMLERIKQKKLAELRGQVTP